MRKENPRALAKLVNQRVKGLAPVTPEEIRLLSESGKPIDVEVLVRDGKGYAPRSITGTLTPAEQLHKGRAEDAVREGNLHLMLYGGYCLVGVLDRSVEISNIYPPDKAQKSPLSPRVLRMYHGKDENFVIDKPVNDFRWTRT